MFTGVAQKVFARLSSTIVSYQGKVRRHFTCGLSPLLVLVNDRFEISQSELSVTRCYCLFFVKTGIVLRCQRRSTRGELNCRFV